MSKQKQFTLPVSDCGGFSAGVEGQGPEGFPSSHEPPKYRVIIWYRDRETAKQAAQAVLEAHLL